MSRPGVVALVVALLVAACQPPPGARRPRRLVLYCSTQDAWCEATKLAFERDTGIQVAMIRKGSGEALAQLLAERRSPKGDVWWGGTGDAHLQAAEARLTEPYRSPRLAELHPWAVDPAGRGEHRTTGIYLGALGFGYNAEVFARKGWAPPRSWEDLLRPELRGEVQVANPQSSGTAYTALATVVQLFGEERGFDYLKRLHANVNQYTKSGSAPTRAAARGETGVAVVFLHDVAAQAAAGFPLVAVAPAEGTGYEVGCVSIVRGARHPEEARAFVDWALSARAQELGATVGALQLPSNRSAAISPDAPRMEGLRLIPLELARFGQKAVRARLLERWEREVKALPR